MTQELYELPEGWKQVSVDDICFKVTDGAHHTPQYTEEGVPFLSVKDVSKGVIDFSNTRFVSAETHEELYKRCNPEFGDILYTKVGTTGIAKVIDTYKEFSLFVSVALLKPKIEIINPKYFELALNAPEAYQQAQSLTRGVANRNLVLRDIKSISINLAPLIEQERIVKKLDALLGRVDTAIEHLEHSLELNDQLFASSLNQAFNPLDAEVQPDGTYQLPEEWEWKTLNDIFEIARGGSPRPIKSFITDNEDGINWIKIGDVATGTKYISQTAEKIKPEGVSKSRMVYPGDFILSNSMSFGRPYIMQIEGCIHDGWLLLRPLDKTVSVDFMYQLLSSPFMYRQFSFAASGTTVKNLNSDIARNSKVPIPNLEKQAAITAKLDLVQAKTQVNKQVLQQKLEQLQQLKASLLDSAFRGEL